MSIPTSPMINILHLIALDQHTCLPFNPLAILLLKGDEDKMVSGNQFIS
jgi:hypothetical protein